MGLTTTQDESRDAKATLLSTDMRACLSNGVAPSMRQEVREIIQMVLAENYRKLDYRESVKGSPPSHLDSRLCPAPCL